MRKEYKVVFNSEYGVIFAVMFSLLSIYCVCSYFYLYHVIKKYFNDNLKEERKMLAKLFAVFTVTFVLFAILIVPDGYYWYLICRKFVRQSLNDIVNFGVQAIVILSVLNIHKKS